MQPDLGVGSVRGATAEITSLHWPGDLVSHMLSLNKTERTTVSPQTVTTVGSSLTYNKDTDIHQIGHLLCLTPSIKVDVTFSCCYAPFNKCYSSPHLGLCFTYVVWFIDGVVRNRDVLFFSYRWPAGSDMISTVSYESTFLLYFSYDHSHEKQFMSSSDDEEHLEAPVCVPDPQLTSHIFLRHTVSLWRQAWVGLPDTPR